MNDSRFDVSGGPAERRMTHSAPHLVATVNLEDSGSAFGTGFRVVCYHFGAGYIVWITNVGFVLLVGAFYYETLGASPHITQPAFPLFAEKPATIFGRARSNESGLFFGGFGSAFGDTFRQTS
jgi:hypothetical protein